MLVAPVAQRLACRARPRRRPGVDRRGGSRLRRPGDGHGHLEAGEHVAAVAVGVARRGASSASSSAVAPSARRPSLEQRRGRRPWSRAFEAEQRGAADSSGGLTSKNGFSVVAPMSVMRPALHARAAARPAATWRSGAPRRGTGSCPGPARRGGAGPARATSRTSFTPALTADELLEGLAGVRRRSAWASVVLPVPGGPQRIDRREAVGLDQRAQRLPGPEQLLLADDVVERARPQPRRERRAAPPARPPPPRRTGRQPSRRRYPHRPLADPPHSRYSASQPFPRTHPPRSVRAHARPCGLKRHRGRDAEGKPHGDRASSRRVDAAGRSASTGSSPPSRRVKALGPGRKDAMGRRGPPAVASSQRVFRVAGAPETWHQSVHGRSARRPTASCRTGRPPRSGG